MRDRTRYILLYIAYLFAVLIVSYCFLEGKEATPAWLVPIWLLIPGLLTYLCVLHDRKFDPIELSIRRRRNGWTYMAFFLIVSSIMLAISAKKVSFSAWFLLIWFYGPALLTFVFNKLRERITMSSTRLYITKKRVERRFEATSEDDPSPSLYTMMSGDTANEMPEVPDVSDDVEMESPVSAPEPVRSVNAPSKYVNELDVIKRMEEHFELVYRGVINELCTLEKCILVFEAICKYYEDQTLPLAVEIRFEQLKEEYKPKFNSPNPMVQVDHMDGAQFEEWCASLLEKVGYYNVSHTGKSGDQGVDITAEKDGVKYAIQCKRYHSQLGNTPIQEVNAGKALYHCHVAVVMTNSSFSKGARALADANGVLLWDRNKLNIMIKTAHDLPIEINYAAKPSAGLFKTDLYEIENKENNTFDTSQKMSPSPDFDDLLPQAVDIVLETGGANSVAVLQRRLDLGYARAARLVDQAEEIGVIGPFEGSRPRQILITKKQWEKRKHELF